MLFTRSYNAKMNHAIKKKTCGVRKHQTFELNSIIYSGDSVFLYRYKCFLNVAKTNGKRYVYLTLCAFAKRCASVYQFNQSYFRLRNFKAFSKRIMRFRNDKRFRCFSQSNQSFVVYRLPFVSMRFSNETNGPVIPWVNMFQEPFRLLIEQVC